jgi:hypothetical protein
MAQLRKVMPEMMTGQKARGKRRPIGLAHHPNDGLKGSGGGFQREGNA